MRVVALLKHAGAHDGDAVAHCHGLDLVVGDVERRHAQASLDAGDLGSHLDTELRVEVGKGLVHQEDARLAYDRAPHRDALALSAGELARLAVDPFGEAEKLDRFVDLRLDLRLRHLAKFEREADVPPDGHVWVERVILEDHRYVAVLRRDVVDDALADAQIAVSDVLYSRNHSQCRRLAASRRPDEDHELTVGDVERELVNRFEAVGVDLGYFVEADRRHFSPFLRGARTGP